MRRLIVMGAAVVALYGCGAPAGEGGREIRVAVTENGFEPESVSVALGMPATLVIRRKVEATCATEAVFAETGRRYDLPLNQDVRIELPTNAATTLHYSCGMEMYHGTVRVK